MRTDFQNIFTDKFNSKFAKKIIKQKHHVLNTLLHHPVETWHLSD